MRFRFIPRLLYFLLLILSIIGLPFDAHADSQIPDSYVSLAKLQAYCQTSALCRTTSPCEGRLRLSLQRSILTTFWSTRAHTVNLGDNRGQLGFLSENAGVIDRDIIS